MSHKSPPLTKSLGFGMTVRPKPAKSRHTSATARTERKARVLLVDPDAESRRLMTVRLGAHYDIETVDHAEAALEACIRSRPNLVITDLHLAYMDGLALLKELKSRWPAVTVIIITACGTIAEAVRATQAGAFGFLVKPVDKAELLGQVKRAIDSSTFVPVEGDWRSGIVARSQLMNDRLELANRASNSDIPVLLTGENGTGKELLARAIHASSARRNGPFIAVRCKDADQATLEAELFGRRGPAADGATARGPGAIDAADGGTLLLEEIGSLPPTLQAELMAILRKTSAGAFGYAPPRIGPRLISTSSCDLKELMNAGEFRQDLFYQINILPIEIPPLGRRREDIPLLVSHFLEQATEPGTGTKIYTPDAIELLATTDWPGNVRQLFDLVKKNVALSHSKIMSKDFVERSLGEAATKVPTYDEAREAFAHEYLTNNLQVAAGNISQAARLAKRNRTDFYKLLARYRVQPHEFKTDGGGFAHKKAGEDD